MAAGAELAGGAGETAGAEGGPLACGGAGWLPQPAAMTNVTATKAKTLTLMALDTPQPAVWLRVAVLLFWYQAGRRALFCDNRSTGGVIHRN
jgi:hypothetical protein